MARLHGSLKKIPVMDPLLLPSRSCFIEVDFQPCARESIGASQSSHSGGRQAADEASARRDAAANAGVAGVGCAKGVCSGGTCTQPLGARPPFQGRAEPVCPSEWTGG